MKFSKKETYAIIIDESILIDKTAINIFEELYNFKSTIEIVIDTQLSKTIENFLLENVEKYYLAKGLLHLLQNNFKTHEIDARNYLNVEIIKDIFKKMNKDVSLAITNKSTFSKQISQDDGIKCYNSSNGKLILWKKTTNVTTEAFYVDKDMMINKPDVSNIKYVYSQKYGYVRLDSKGLFVGGEGTVYKTYNGFFVKIFDKDHITYTNYKKLLKMIELDIYRPNIKWPLDIVYYQGDFVGYLMEEVKDSIPLDILRIENFNGMDFKKRFKLVLEFLKTVEYLHKKNIVIGDMKLDNLLIDKNENLHFVDCGTYQIEDYACPVCHPDYTLRILTEEELKKTLRSFDDEYYPINRIMFEIIFKKNPNFNPTGHNTNYDEKLSFHYPIDAEKIENLPKREDTQIWKSFSQNVREMFYYYFTEQRVSELSEWINVFDRILSNITI